MNIQVRGRAETLDQRDRTAVGLARLQSRLPEQETREHPVHDLQDWGQCGCAASSRRSGTGSDSTHWRTGPQLIRCTSAPS
jgi:hypothetical protein